MDLMLWSLVRSCALDRERGQHGPEQCYFVCVQRAYILTCGSVRRVTNADAERGLDVAHKHIAYLNARMHEFICDCL